MSDALKGQDYRARRRLSDQDDHTLAEVGETCERVPVESLEPLLASGHIELAVERRAATTHVDTATDASPDANAPTATVNQRKARK